MKRWIGLAAIPLLAGCQTMPFGGDPAFRDHDTDGDNVISRQEANTSPRLGKHFARIDTNGSGGIDPREYAAAMTYIAGIDFKRVDINDDGVISRSEARAMPASLKEAFARVDTDGDDNVSPAEYRAATVNLLEGLDFATLDRDGDGVIGTDEAHRVPELRASFGRIDTDNDGLISKKEFAASQR
ncbi:EF-hand domain-containing protein [Halofilum ochraceum]|uniref:EF-hand domain-containing protein n=1 Tax=Halofilum ochraceum TaxID=1611323 RepID=UPI0008329629|nr:EF-hand domain-containing protein [Halofilum ochraceum]